MILFFIFKQILSLLAFLHVTFTCSGLLSQLSVNTSTSSASGSHLRPFVSTEVSPVRPGQHGVERQAADHLLPHRVSVGRLQLRPLPAGRRGTGRQVPGRGAIPAGPLAVL